MTAPGEPVATIRLWVGTGAAGGLDSVMDSSVCIAMASFLLRIEEPAGNQELLLRCTGERCKSRADFVWTRGAEGRPVAGGAAGGPGPRRSWRRAGDRRY